MRKYFIGSALAVLAAATAMHAPCAHAKARSFVKTAPTSGAVTISGWTVLNDSYYVANASNDGDSFHVTAAGKPYLFRLYFVDTPETDTGLGDRIDEQAKYFGITPEQTVTVGKLAQEFTREKLTQAFAVRTCFQDALGRSKMQRF
ncbi:MAG: hypothetical protein ABJB69_10105 [Spartobacteria bacterium]